MQSLNILVTGGARGIGSGIVRELAAAGHHVGFCGRAPLEKCADFLGELRGKDPGRRLEYFQCDVSDGEDRLRMLDEFEQRLGSLDVLVNNAGVAPLVRADVLEMTEESFCRVLDINLRGPFFLTQQAAKRMSENGSGRFRCIINISSISADYASVNRGEYCLSKAGVSMATKLWAARLAEFGIPVYEIRPGVIHSDMTSGVTEKYDRMIAEDDITLQKRWGEPSDVGKAVAMLVSGALAYSTGQVINVDGGFSVQRF